MPLLCVIRHEPAHVIHPYRIRREFGEVWQNMRCETRSKSLSRFVYVYLVRKTAIADVPVTRLYRWFRVHDMCQVLHILNLVLSCLQVIPVAGLHGSLLRGHTHAEINKNKAGCKTLKNKALNHTHQHFQNRGCRGLRVAHTRSQVSRARFACANPLACDQKPWPWSLLPQTRFRTSDL